MSNQIEGDQPQSEINRREAIKLAAGAAALSSVLGVAIGEAGAAGQDGRLMGKVEFSAGDRPLQTVDLTQAQVDYFLKGDLAQYKITFWSWGKDMEPRRMGSQGLDPRTQEAIMKLRRELDGR